MFVFGVKELDQMFKDTLLPGSLVVVVGHPGAGKTTLASTICSANAVNGKKCLYITFQENRKKLFMIMKRLGIDLENLEARELLQFVKFPIAITPEDAIAEIGKLVNKGGFSVVVVDSINSLLKSVEKDEVRRAWLQNYFYELACDISGLVVLVAELPFGGERVELGDIEFVADAVLILKHQVEKGLLVRSMEIRKIRGAPLTIAEIPFSIVKGKGITLHPPIVMEDIGSEYEEIMVASKDMLVLEPVKRIERIFGRLRRGQVLYIAYPPYIRPVEIVLSIILGIAILNKLKVGVISYKYSSKNMEEFLTRTLTGYGLEEKNAENLVREFFVFNSVNPFSLSLPELIHRHREFTDSCGCDMVMFHEIELLQKSAPTSQWLQVFFNLLNYLKMRKKMIALTASTINDELFGINSALSDVILKFEPIETTDGLDYKTLIWSKGYKPYVASPREVEQYVQELVSLVKATARGEHR